MLQRPVQQSVPQAPKNGFVACGCMLCAWRYVSGEEATRSVQILGKFRLYPNDYVLLVMSPGPIKYRLIPSFSGESRLQDAHHGQAVGRHSFKTLCASPV